MFTWVWVVTQHKRWHLHGWGQSWGVLVGVCADLCDDVVQLWVDMGTDWQSEGCGSYSGRKTLWRGGLGLPSGDVALGMGCDGLLRSLERI